jgi:hypothetical protein
MIITHDHRVTVFPNDEFSRKYIYLVKASNENKGYASTIKKTTLGISIEWQEGFVNSEVDK